MIDENHEDPFRVQDVFFGDRFPGVALRFDPRLLAMTPTASELARGQNQKLALTLRSLIGRDIGSLMAIAKYGSKTSVVRAV